MDTTKTDRRYGTGNKMDKREYKRDDNVSPSNYLGTILGISLVMFFIFLPVWPYAIAWGYYPAVGFGLICLIALFFVAIGYAKKKRDPRY